MRQIVLGFVLLLLAGPTLADDRPLNRIVADYEAYALAEDPFEAGRQGDPAALFKLPDVTPSADARRARSLAVFQVKLGRIGVAGLSTEARLNYDFLAWTLDRQAQSLAFDEARMPFNSDGGFNQTLGYFATTTPVRNVTDAKAWIARLRALPKYYADNIANARRGVASGFTQPATTNDQVLAHARAQVAIPVEADGLLAPLRSLPPGISTAEQADLLAEATTVLRDQVRPAQQTFVSFLEKEYLPAGRKSLAARSLPNGEAYYRWLVADQTTTSLTPDQIHQTGLNEVARIRKEMDGVIAQTGFKGDFRAFQVFLRTDPRFYATSREDLLEKASRIAKRIDNELPGWFATLPRLTYGVRPVPADIEETYTTGRYFGGSPKQGVAGGYMVNTSKLDQRPLYELPALTLHEAVPGHHLQIALGDELENVPNFRRSAGVTAFTEGWGLYAEKLGGEMGIYRDPYERFGRLSYEMWRACRLVADTGIHWKGWSLDQARSCFSENTALSPLNIEVELARYVSWPGQALAYKIGEMKLVELRARAQTALGDRFDIRRFHDVVLLAGPLPLNLLEQRVDAWIAREKSKPAQSRAS